MSQHIKRFRPSLKQILFGGLGSSVGVLGVLFAVAIYVVDTIVHPTKKRNALEDYTYSPFEFDLPAQNVTFSPLRGDYQVSGWFVPYPQATTTILVCPGYRTRKSDVLGISRQLWKAGHNLLIFDYYGHGTDVGTPVTLGYREINDFFGAVAYVKEHVPETHLGVMAYSMGASIAIMCCAHSSEVEVLALDSAFATHRSVVDYLFRRRFPLPPVPFIWLADQLIWWRAKYHFRQVEPLRDIGKLSPRPILLIHGENDSIVDPRDATLLYNAADEPKELWLVAEADHCGAYFVDRLTYIMRVTTFFEVYLKKPRLQLVENKPEGQAETGDLDNSHSGLSEAS